MDYPVRVEPLETPDSRDELATLVPLASRVALATWAPLDRVTLLVPVHLVPPVLPAYRLSLEIMATLADQADLVEMDR